MICQNKNKTLIETIIKIGLTKELNSDICRLNGIVCDYYLSFIHLGRVRARAWRCCSGPPVISDNGTSQVQYQPVTISVVIENYIVVSLHRLADAFLVMFGLIYALHLSYPKGLTNTFEFTEGFTWSGRR